MRSLQRMLALRSGATMFVALMAVAAWAYLGVRAALARQVDRSIASTAGLMLDVVENGEPLAEHMGAMDLPGFVAEVNRLVVTRDSSGGILDRNSPLAGDLPFDNAAFLLARAGKPAYSTGDLSGIRIRSYYLSTPAHPRVATRGAVIQVAASLAPLSRESRAVLLRLLATGLLGTILTAIGAGWLARSSLAPVADIAAHARTVTSRGPRQQITVHADVVELQDLIQVLNDMLGRMERALSQQRRIISDVGHELRTPITVMRGEVEVALRGTRQPEQYQAMLRSVLEEVDHLALMGEELIVLARCESGELTPRPVACDLKDLVARAVAEARRRHPDEPIEVDLAEVRLNADPRLLGMAIDQLIDNALRHTPSGTPIRLTTREEGAQACLAVEDAGPGVPEESLSQLTEPFFRTDRARGRGGAGLGLTVVSAIAALHGGSITASRGSMGGLRVEVALPNGIKGSTRPG
jgi:signal transduction histidine kinase